MVKKACLIVWLTALWIPLQGNLPYVPIQWPADDQAHLSNPHVVTEWWYFAGKLTATRGLETRHFLYVVTARYMRDLAGDVPLLEVKLMDLDKKRVHGTSMFLGKARLSTFKTSIAADDFYLEPDHNGYILRLTVPIDSSQVEFNLTMTPQKKHFPVTTNVAEPGLIDMGSDTNSYYYVIPRMHTEGYIRIDNKQYVINPDIQFSRSWMEHQWGDFSMLKTAHSFPWVWASIQLKDGTDIAVNQFLVSGSGKLKGEGFASISLPDGTVEYKRAKITFGTEYSKGYPLAYDIQIGDKTYQLRTLLQTRDVNNAWTGIMSVNGNNIFEPNASFALVESTLQALYRNF